MRCKAVRKVRVRSCPLGYYSSQGAFQQGLSVVTVYASLGDEALVHALNEVSLWTPHRADKMLPVLEGNLMGCRMHFPVHLAHIGHLEGRWLPAYPGAFPPMCSDGGDHSYL